MAPRSSRRELHTFKYSPARDMRLVQHLVCSAGPWQWTECLCGEVVDICMRPYSPAGVIVLSTLHCSRLSYCFQGLQAV